MLGMMRPCLGEPGDDEVSNRLPECPATRSSGIPLVALQVLSHSPTFLRRETCKGEKEVRR